MGLDAGSLFGAAASVGGNLLGQSAAAGDRGEARNQEEIANNIIQELQNAPDISKPLILEKYKQAGILTPQMEQNINTAMPETITTNPAFKSAQMQALNQMQQRSQQGLTQGDRAALNQAQLQAQGDTKSRLASIQQQMQQQGQANGGSALAMKLAAAQNESNQLSTNADQQAMISQQARENALGQLGQYANSSQAQDFSQQQAQQQAKDQMARFNTQNQLGVQQQNVGAANQAQAANLTNLQNVNNMNVGQGNQELNNQLNRQTQEWQNNNNLAAMKSNSARGLGGYLQSAGDKTAQGYANMGNGIASAVSSSGSGGGGGGGLGSLATMFAAHGGKVPDFRKGGSVPGNAPVKGDSPENDVVHAMLSPGEIVLPRTISQSKFGKHILKIIDAHNNLKKHMNGDENE